MKGPNLLCRGCQSRLLDRGVVIDSQIGPMLVCAVCKELYYIEVGSPADPELLGKGLSLYVKVADIPLQDKLYIISQASRSVPFAQYFEDKPEAALPDIDLKAVINSATTPSDLLRKLNSNDR